MEPGSLTWVGSPCGFHGPYIFYKAFGFNLDCRRRLLSLGDFFLVRCEPGQPLRIAELQLLWEDRTSHQLLSSSKLYFLPEDTPQGRSANHGEDEVIAVSEKVVVRLEDLVKWTVWDHHTWNRGMKALPLKLSTANTNKSWTDSFLLYHDSNINRGLHFKDVLKEKAALGESFGLKRVLVLSYPRYCRYRSVVARLCEQPTSLLTNQVVLALGGIAVLSENTHILYCRDTFHDPMLLHNKSICDEFAPNLKGRPRKKKLSNSLYQDSQGQSRGLVGKGHCQTTPSSKKTETTTREVQIQVIAEKARPSRLNGNSSKSINDTSQTTTIALSDEKQRRGRGVQYKAEEQAFLVSLYKYMKLRKTPIERIPYLGFRQINLWTMFQTAQNLGGYELITVRRQWKNVYDELGGNPGSTSAATCTRRHYERLILPFERFIRGEEDKPLPQFKPRKQESNSSMGSSDSICDPILKAKPCPEKNDIPNTKDQDYNRLELKEQNSQMELEPQTRLDPLQPSESTRKRQSPTQECQNDTEIRLMLQHEDKVKRKRRYSRCDHSYLTTSPMTKDEKSVFPLATPKIFDHALSAMDLWQHQQVTLQGQCHVGKPRNLQSPTIPESPSDQAELPRTEDTSSGFTILSDSSGVRKAFISPLAKKKLSFHVSSTGLPNQDHCHYNYGQPPPPIFSSFTKCIMEEAAEKPALVTTSSVVVLSRPSVIQHVQSSKVKVQKDRKGLIKESTAPPPSRSQSPLLSYQKEPQCLSTPLLRVPQSTWKPQGVPRDLFSSLSHQFCWQGAAEKSCGTVNTGLVHEESKQPQEQFATDQDTSCNPKTTASYDQPTDLSLRKSTLKPLQQQKSTSVLSQNGITAIKVAHYSGAKQASPLTLSPVDTFNPRQDPTVEHSTRAEEAVHNGEVVKKQIVSDKEVQALGSQLVLHNTHVLQHLSTLGNSISKSQRQAVTATPKDILSPLPRKIETPKELDDSFVVESAEGTEGGAAASPFSFLNPISPQIYPNIRNPSRTLALSQGQNMCRDTLSIPLAMDQPPCWNSNLQKPLQYLKTQSTEFRSPSVPANAINSQVIQKQLLAQAAASPRHIHQQTWKCD